MTAAPPFAIVGIDCFERPVRLRLPFRFGAVTVTHAPQAFVRVRIRLTDGREASGASAELMVPKWFDKDPARTERQSFDQLRRSLALAAEAYRADGRPRSAFGHFAAHYAELVGAGRDPLLPPLAAGFGPAEVDKAILDALGRALGVSFATLVRENLPGIAPASLAPDLAGFDFDAFCRTLQPARSIAVRHTVGMLDALEGHPGRVHDGLPESLEEAIEAYGLRYFKLKLAGAVDEDLARLGAIARVLDRRAPGWIATLDGNEQYPDATALQELWRRIDLAPDLARLAHRVAFIEQPFARSRALATDLRAFAHRVPLIIDESDGTLDAFVEARAAGYSGVSSKACKGVYKGLINRARCALWNADARSPTWFMSAEDLTTQAGLAVQQDLAIAGLLGVAHVERNGHHYVHGFAGQHAPADEQEAFVTAHPSLYERVATGVCLRIVGGALPLDSLEAPGFASGAYPDWASLEPMPAPADDPPRDRAQRHPV